MKALVYKHKLFYLLALAFCTVLFLLIVTLPKGEPLLYINQYHKPVFDKLFYAITFLGDGLLATIILVVVFIFVSMRKALVTTFTFLSVVLVVQVLKNFFFDTAPRPHTFFEDLTNVYYVPWIEVHGYNSFPSGHTAQAFCLALCMLFYVQRKSFALALFTLAALTGFSRLYLMQHFPADVLGGTIIAVIITTVAFYFLEYKIPLFQHSRLDSPLFRIQKQ